MTIESESVASIRVQAEGMGLDRADCEILLAHVLNTSRAKLIAYPELPITGSALAQIRAQLAARSAGAPVAYLLGQREFFGLMLKVSPDVLIPRPETELLVEIALARCRLAEAQVLDLGTGSGAIALALKAQRPHWHVTGTDRMSAALVVAQDNAAQLQLDVQFRLTHWFESLEQTQFDVVISNPPYVAQDDPHLSQGDLRFEPTSALTDGADGLQDLRTIIAGARRFLRPAGWLMLEHGHDQVDAVAQMLRENYYEAIENIKDYSGLPRVSLARA